MSNYIELNLKPIKSQRASEIIYETLKAEIMSGKVKPGDRLPSERILMEQLQKSRHPIREALRMLEQEGLIKIVPGSSGAIVTHMSTDALTQSLKNMLVLNQVTPADLAEFRAANETTYAKWAAERRTDEELAELKKCLDTSANYYDDYLSFFSYEIEFHEIIYSASHNEVASIVGKLIHDLFNQLLIKMYAGIDANDIRPMLESIQQDHTKIYNAIAEKNANAAYRYMQDHMTRFRNDMLNSTEHIQ